MRYLDWCSLACNSQSFGGRIPLLGNEVFMMLMFITSGFDWMSVLYSSVITLLFEHELMKVGVTVMDSICCKLWYLGWNMIAL